MTTKAAAESKLGELHSKVADVMANALQNVETGQRRYEENENDLDGPPEVSAALLGVITKFLNDNKISCVPEDSASMTDLEKRLHERRSKRQRVGNVVHLVPEE